ncbi:hypothetical protein ABBQ38_006897 [Trebouxia sp. C0009 RCD-2024]
MNALLLFRKGLRVHDNPALLEALTDCKQLYPVFVFDPWFAGNGKVGTNRFSFLLDSLHDLDASFKARGSRLIIVHGNPPDVVPQLIKAWKINKVCFEADTEPYSVERDRNMIRNVEATGVPWHSFVSHTLYDTAKLLHLNKGQVVTAYSAFQRLTQRAGLPGQPVGDPPSLLPPIPADAQQALAMVGLKEAGVPSLADIGYHDQPTSPFKGGETLALKRLKEHTADKAWVVQFEKPKGNPAALVPATTVLSPYLKFGCLSIRVFYQRLQQIEAEAKQSSKPPVSLRGQLLWREFFYFVGANTPNFDRMEGNPICKQIPWDTDAVKVAAWEAGKTGFPWIDACMRQLQLHGWMHHLARHAVACFLTRGDLYCPWEAGRDVFDRLLIDDDWSINNANWMWLSASAFFYQYHRVYSPITFGKKYDPNGDFVRKFVPELKDFPAKWIYEPWKAPIADQKQANCRIGVDYPKPMVDHAAVSKENIQKLKDAYAANSPASKIKPPPRASPAATATLPGHAPASQARPPPRASPAVKATLYGRKQTSIPVDPLPRQDAQPQPVAPSQPASAAGSSSQEPKSGFVDVVMPREPDAAATAASPGPSDDKGPGAGGQDARQDAAEPEATLPGGTATGVGGTGSDKSHSTARDAKQRRLDWSAAAGKKRKAGGGVQPMCDGLQSRQQLTRPPSKRQSKLKVVLSKV